MTTTMFSISGTNSEPAARLGFGSEPGWRTLESAGVVERGRALRSDVSCAAASVPHEPRANPATPAAAAPNSCRRPNDGPWWSEFRGVTLPSRTPKLSADGGLRHGYSGTVLHHSCMRQEA